MKTLVSIFAFGAILASFGCGDSNYGGQVNVSPAEAQAQLDARIKEIENNDKMPPQAKAAAIASLQNSKAMSQGAPGAPGPKK